MVAVKAVGALDEVRVVPEGMLASGVERVEVPFVFGKSAVVDGVLVDFDTWAVEDGANVVFGKLTVVGGATVFIGALSVV